MMAMIMLLQKPTPKLSLQAAKFERKINAQTRAVEASKTKVRYVWWRITILFDCFCID